MNPAAPPRVLVVDDSKVSRTLAVGLLRNRLPQAEFLEAADGQSALALAATAPPDLVVLDFNMPGISGTDAAEALLRAHPATRIVLLTANGQAAVQARAEALGIALLRKPIRPELADRIAAMLEVPA